MVQMSILLSCTEINTCLGRPKSHKFDSWFRLLTYYFVLNSFSFTMFNGLNFLGLACTWEVRGFETKSLQSRNSYFDHSISIHGLTQIRHVALYWFKGRSLHVLNWSRGIRFGIFELGLWYSMWSLFHCFNVGDHDFEFRNIISGQHFNNLGDSLR